MRYFIAFLLLLFLSNAAFAQIGIGTNTPNNSAKLEVSASNKGFLPPRIALTGSNDQSTISNPAEGLLVYNTATAGTSPNNVIPGYYYYAGGAWQRILNQQPDAVVNFDKVTPTTSGVSFTPNYPASANYVYISSVDNSLWTYNGTTYVTYAAPANSAWYLSGGTTDAGSNKTADIYRTGKVGIGTSTPAAKLDINGTLKVVDGSQGANKVLTSDANGLATWQSPYSIGDFKLSAQSANHNGWLLCNGTTVSRTTYASLFALIGTSFGVGNGSTTFTLPDFRGRVPGGIGTGSGLTARSMGNSVGEENHTQTVNEMPSHSHSYGAHWSDGGGWNNGTVQMSDRGLNGYNSVNNTGGGQAFNVMQPTLFGGNYFIYAGQ